MTEETWSQYSARLERERREMEQHAQNLCDALGALVRKYGEPVGTDAGPSWRVSLTETERMDAMGGTLSTNLDPNSGALLIRFRPE